MQNVEQGLKDVCMDHINPEITGTVIYIDHIYDFRLTQEHHMKIKTLFNL